MRVLEGGASPASRRHGLPTLERPRTRVMLLLALLGLAAATGTLVLPLPLAGLFCLMLTATASLSLRGPALGSLLAALAATLALALMRLMGLVLEADPESFLGGSGLAGLDRLLGSPALRYPGVWAATLETAALLLAPSLLAIWTSPVLARPAPRELAPSRLVKTKGHPLAAEAGLELAGWELQRAARYRRRVTLALIGIDGAQEAAHTRAAPLSSWMAQLDQLLLRDLSRFETVAEHRLDDRLLVLPEVWADSYAAEAGRLCQLASQRIGRPVRAALASFPIDGSTVEELLGSLETALEACRAGGTEVSAGSLGATRTPVTDFAS
jgi:hypothetical protein